VNIRRTVRVVSIDAASFDSWYADIEQSTRQDQFSGRLLGLPPRLKSTSLLSWDGIAEVVDALDLRPGTTLLDLACGRGGYGLEVARRTGARLIGVDFSETALRQAAASVADLGGIEAAFRTGTLTDTGLPTDHVDAVMCVDAIQFAQPTTAATAECRRVLRPGGRLVATAWQARDRTDEAIPARSRLLDLEAALEEAGFDDIKIDIRSDWLDLERRYWTAAIELDPEKDEALLSLQEEANQLLPILDGLDRVIARARA
jgi:SAM-dependent methyltransferase